uniref:Uncharacterized protein n=1 Tax=viral metagenome TaxID=1070528 RepID=A0A6C0JA83_9ZZZZ
MSTKYNYTMRGQEDAYSELNSSHFPLRLKVTFEGEPGERKNCLHYIWKKTVEPSVEDKEVIDKFIATGIRNKEETDIIKKWKHRIGYGGIPVKTFFICFKPRIELPDSSIDGEDIKTILRHYLLEEEITRIETLVLAFQKSEIPDMSEDTFPVIYAIANLFKWASDKIDIDDAFMNAHYGTIQAEQMSQSTINNYQLDIPGYEESIEDSYVGEYYVYLDYKLVGCDFPDYNFAIAEIMGYKNKFGYSIDSWGISYESKTGEYHYPVGGAFEDSFEAYLEFWRKV